MNAVVLHPEAFHTPERKIRLLLASLPVFAGLLSEDGRVLECNFGPLGQPVDGRSDWVGRPFETGPWWNYSEDSRSDILILLGRAREGHAVSKERLYRKTDGSMGVMMLTLKPLFAPYGQPDAILVMAVDVTERHRATDTAERVAHDMAHRLRNSFTVMRLLATRTVDGSDAPGYPAALSTRLSLIRAGHELAFRYLFFEVPIEEIVDTAVGERRLAHADFVPVSVPSDHVQALLLAFGELAAAGRDASVGAKRIGTDRLRLTWQEADTRALEDMPQGLSRQLLDSALAMQVGGTVSMGNVGDDGFRWQLDMPVASPPPAPGQPEAQAGG